MHDPIEDQLEMIDYAIVQDARDCTLAIKNEGPSPILSAALSQLRRKSSGSGLGLQRF
jgi:hypothetical protein